MLFSVPLAIGNLRDKDRGCVPKVSFIRRFHCIINAIMLAIYASYNISNRYWHLLLPYSAKFSRALIFAVFVVWPNPRKNCPQIKPRPSTIIIFHWPSTSKINPRIYSWMAIREKLGPRKYSAIQYAIQYHLLLANTTGILCYSVPLAISKCYCHLLLLVWLLPYIAVQCVPV